MVSCRQQFLLAFLYKLSSILLLILIDDQGHASSISIILIIECICYREISPELVVYIGICSPGIVILGVVGVKKSLSLFYSNLLQFLKFYCQAPDRGYLWTPSLATLYATRVNGIIQWFKDKLIDRYVLCT